MFVTVLVGQTMLGWDNDLVDRGPRRAARPSPASRSPSGLLDPGTVWFSLTCALLLVVPLSLSAGTRAGGAYLVALVIGSSATDSCAAASCPSCPGCCSFGLYPAYIAYGGWNGVPSDTPPTVAMTVLAALLGLGVHVLRALPGLVPDNVDGLRSLAAAARAQDRRAASAC